VSHFSLHEMGSKWGVFFFAVGHKIGMLFLVWVWNETQKKDDARKKQFQKKMGLVVPVKKIKKV
jgi:hypothetical protein